MNNLVQRLLTFFVGIPLILLLVLWQTDYNHLALNVMIVIAAFLGSREMVKLCSESTNPMNWNLIPLLAAAYPLLVYLVDTFHLGSFWEMAYPVVVFLFILMRQIFLLNQNDFSQVIDRLSRSILCFIYPSVFLSFITRLTTLNNSSSILLFFFLVVTMNDSLAWLFGVLFGKHRNIFKVSPNKSIEGFIAGIASSVAVTLVFNYFAHSFQLPLLGLILMGILLGIVTIAGDLVESSLKRSGGKKDSGNIVPGRGGVLDSIDSLIFAGSVIYLFSQF